jgi:nucleoside-diphosphate-sugar epimerase
MVGRNLASYLKDHSYDPIPTDLSGWEFSGDLLDKDFVFKKLGSIDFDAIIHLAAVTEIKKTVEDPRLCFEVNCVGTLNVLELAHRKKVKKIICASSANVFGAPKVNPVKEDAPFDPRLPYDYSKVICENLAMSYYRTKGLPVTLTRGWLLFGEHDQPSRATIRFIRACLKNEPLTLFNAGKDTTAPTHATNYASLCSKIIDNDNANGQAFNFGGEKPVSVRELAETVKRLTGSKSELVLAPPRTELEKDPQVSYPSIEKAKSQLGYKQELSLEQGLMRTIEWVRKQS